MKFTIPSDHPVFKDAKVGDTLTMTGKVTATDDEGATAEIEKCEIGEMAAREPRKKMTPIEYIIRARRKAMA